MKRLRNTSGIPDEKVRTIIQWIASRLGIDQFDVSCRNCNSTVAGRAYIEGAKNYHGNRRPFVVLRIGTETIDRWKSGTKSSLRRCWLGSHQETAIKISKQRFPTTVEPYQYAHLKGKWYVVANRIEALVYIAAHELMHLHQAARHDDKRKSKNIPRVFRARGKFSEIETESFAIHMLREYRRWEGDLYVNGRRREICEFDGPA